MDRFLIKLSRIASYILIVIIVLMLITGYRLTGHFVFITRGFANTLHSIYFNITFIFLFTIHSLTAIRFALIRNKIKGKYIDILLIAIGVAFIAGFIYFAF
jgi:hypothetical protein